MDSLTQATLGAAVGEALLGAKIGRKAALFGAIAGTIPDLDIVLVPLFNDLQRISLHRGYSHSILFCLLGGWLIAWGLRKADWGNGISFARLFTFGFLALFTHVLLDTFTPYGTQLFLPFSDYRAGFDSITIIDPLYTLPLLLGLLCCLIRRNATGQRWNGAGLLVSSAYLVFTLFNKQEVAGVFARNFEEQGIHIRKMLTVPVTLGNVLWYGVGMTDDGMYLGNYSILDHSRHISFTFFPTADELLENLDPQLTDRLKWFAKGYYWVHAFNDRTRFYNLQVDMQGLQHEGYLAPTAFFYEIESKGQGGYNLLSKRHPPETGFRDRLERAFGQ